MLLELDRGLRPAELEAMKFFCSDQIPARQREEIVRSVRLWEVLEERELLRPDNTVFLKKLLRDAAGAREDLLNIITRYEEQYTTTQNDSPTAKNFTKDFDLILKNINYKRWRTLARRLGLSDTAIDNLAEKYHGNVQEQIRHALILWSQDETATRESLISALKSCEMNMIAHQMETSFM